MNRKVIALAAGLAALTLLVSGPAAAAPMTSAGPLEHVEVSSTLNCDVRMVGDSRPEFFGSTACATMVAAGGVLYRPLSIPAGDATGGEPWTPVSQQNSGTGVSGDPLTTVTVVRGGDLEVEQTDTYLVGQNFYATRITVRNTGSEPLSSVVYHAADCYLQNNDRGFGDYESATGAVTCRAPSASGDYAPDTRIEQFIPLTSGSDHYYGSFSSVWQAAGTMLPLPNVLDLSRNLIDNGMALSWSLELAPGSSSTVELLTNFSPMGVIALPTSLAVDRATAPAGEAVTVTGRIENDSLYTQQLTGIMVTLPAGARYLSGTSTLGEPVEQNGALVFPDSGLAPGATLEWTYQVTSDAELSAQLSLSAVAGSGAPVLGSSTEVVFTPNARVTLPTSITSSAAAVVVGDRIVVTVGISNPHGEGHTIDELRVALPDGLSVVPGTASSTSEPILDGNDLVFSDAVLLAAGATYSLTFEADVTASFQSSAAVTGTSSTAYVRESAVQLEARIPNANDELDEDTDPSDRGTTPAGTVAKDHSSALASTGTNVATWTVAAAGGTTALGAVITFVLRLRPRRTES